MTKTFAMFGGYDHSPRGGRDDFIDTYATLEEAVSHASQLLQSDIQEIDWYHVVDLRTMKIVARRD